MNFNIENLLKETVYARFPLWEILIKAFIGLTVRIT